MSQTYLRRDIDGIEIEVRRVRGRTLDVVSLRLNGAAGGAVVQLSPQEALDIAIQLLKASHGGQP